MLQSQSVLNEEWSPNESGEGSPPIPPPRPKRKNKIKIKNLSLDSNETLREESHQNDILFRTDSATRLNRDTSCLKGLIKTLTLSIPAPFTSIPLLGSISLLTVTTVGLRQTWKPRFAVYDPSQCKLNLFKNSDETELVGELDIQGATFTYDLDNDNNGMFKIW